MENAVPLSFIYTPIILNFSSVPIEFVVILCDWQVVAVVKDVVDDTEIGEQQQGKRRQAIPLSQQVFTQTRVPPNVRAPSHDQR